MISRVAVGESLRLVEWALVATIAGTLLLVGLFGGFPGFVPRNGSVRAALFWTAVFGAPLALGVTALVTAAADEVGIGSLLAGAVALVTIYVVIAAVHAIFSPPSGGGVYFGYFFSFGAGLLLAVAVVLRPFLDRLGSRVWRRPGLIDQS